MQEILNDVFHVSISEGRNTLPTKKTCKSIFLSVINLKKEMLEQEHYTSNSVRLKLEDRLDEILKHQLSIDIMEMISFQNLLIKVISNLQTD